MGYVSLAIYGVLGLLALFTFLSGFYMVQTQTAAVVQRFGKFHKVAEAGLNFKLPWVDRVVYRENLHMQLLDVKIQTKTADDSIVTLPVRVQYYVLKDKVEEAYYTLDNPEKQIVAHVENVILGFVPSLSLEDVYKQENQIATKVKLELQAVMEAFGYGIENALLTQIMPDAKVAEAMNAINAARRNQVAAEAEGEAQYIRTVKAAKAESESKRLQGEGIAAQRTAIINGLKDSVHQFAESVEGATPTDVMAMVLTTQYFDTLKEIAAHANMNSVMIPHSPGAISDIFNQIVQAKLLSTNKTA